MKMILRSITAMLLSVLAITVSATPHNHQSGIHSIILEEVRMEDDNQIHIYYTVSFSAPVKTGENVYCFITPIDSEGNPYPDGKGSFLTSGGLFSLPSPDCNVTIDLPAYYIKRIPGVDEYHLKVNVVPETNDDFFHEECYSFTYSDLTQAAKSGAIQQTMNIFDLLLGGDTGNSESESILDYKPSHEVCDRCYGSGLCRLCNGEGNCPACSNGACPKCDGSGRIRIED